jgi:hypothetical protein
MEQLRRDAARSTSYRSRFLHRLSVSLFAGVALLTISAFFGYPISFTGGSTSCLFVASEYQCVVTSPVLIVWDYAFWAFATLLTISALELAFTRSSTGPGRSARRHSHSHS